MKKYLFFVVAAFVCSTVSAQLVTSTSFKKGKSNTVWYVKAGMNISKITGDNVDVDNKIGYNVGLAFDKPIGTSGLFWGSGLQLATKGFKTSVYDVEETFTAHKLELPLNFGYKYAVNDDIAIDARVGGFINYDLFGKLKITEDGESVSANLGDIDGYDRLGAGIQFGVGVWYQKLYLNFTLQKGLIEQWEKAKESNFMISLGYAF